MMEEKKFEIDVTLIDRLDYFDDSDTVVNIFPEMSLTKRELKKMLKQLVIENKGLLEKMKYV